MMHCQQSATSSGMSLNSANWAQGEVHDGYLSLIPDFSSDLSFSLAGTLPTRVYPPYVERSEEDKYLRGPFTATLEEPFHQPDLQFLSSIEANLAADHHPANDNQQERHTSTASQSHQHRISIMSAFSFEQAPTKKPSYYSQALTEEDKQALAYGKKNHNHKEWSAMDLVTHHESRKHLVPCVMLKMDKVNALAAIEHDKQHSQRALSQVKDQEEDATYSEQTQASHSTYNLLPSPTPRRPSLPPSLSTPNFAVDNASHERRQLHARATSSGDYFSQRPARRSGAYRASRISPLASVSGTSSDSSSRVRSPLAQEVQYRLNPEVTFDSFLAPHMSGKGEAFHDADNAKTTKAPHMSPKDSTEAKEKMRRLSKMPSMSLLS
ncbi:hypothetical protein P3342_005520 [Pyrenophora teres f. teres]|nr:hypothetical protein P3342_005520 [Pyrenophora teres f. teres]